MKCPKCGSENSDSSKFCKTCGEPIHTSKPDNKNKIIIGVLVIVIAILAVGVLFGMGVFKEDVPLETKDFGAFKLDVPVGSNYVLKDSSSTNKSNLFVGYENKGDYEFEAFGFFVGNNITKNSSSWSGELYQKEGNMEIYKNVSDGKPIYNLYYDAGNGKIIIIGSDADNLKNMAKSFRDFDEKKLISNQSQPTAQSSTTQTAPVQSSTPSSISILGGSFSTGSAEEDKTYASHVYFNQKINKVDIKSKCDSNSRSAKNT